MQLVKLLNNPTVVPESYTQYPGMLPPSKIYGGTWEAQFEDVGIFFRTPGGTASDFNGGVQEAANTEHTHEKGTMNITGSAQFGANRAVRAIGTGAFKPVGYAELNAHGGGGITTTGTRLDFNAADTWEGETSADGVVDGRPKNMTYRIWKRVI